MAKCCKGSSDSPSSTETFRINMHANISTACNCHTVVRFVLSWFFFFSHFLFYFEKKLNLLWFQSTCLSSCVTCASALITDCFHLFPITLHVLQQSESPLSGVSVFVCRSGHLGLFSVHQSISPSVHSHRDAVHQPLFLELSDFFFFFCNFHNFVQNSSSSFCSQVFCFPL